MTGIRHTCGRARVVSQLREPTQTSIQPANLRTHASRQRYDRKNDAHRQEPLRGRCGGLHPATRSVSPMRALVGGERRRGAHDLYIKKHLLVEGATGKGGFIVCATGADGQDTAPSSAETRLRAQACRTRSFLRQRRSGSDAHSASRTSAFVVARHNHSKKTCSQPFFCLMIGAASPPTTLLVICLSVAPLSPPPYSLYFSWRRAAPHERKK